MNFFLETYSFESGGNKVSEGNWRRDRVGRRVTHLNSIKGPNFMPLKMTTVEQYKNYIHNLIYKNAMHLKKMEQLEQNQNK